MDSRDVLDHPPSSTELTRMTGRDLKWVQRQTRRLGMLPVYTRGERQFSQADTVKLILLARLQSAFGETSALPFTIVSDDAVASLLRSPSRGAVLPISTQGLLLAVGVPALAELVGA